MSSILYDHRGNPIAGPEKRAKANATLPDFMAKNHSMFQDWFTANGYGVRPPIFFDTENEEWVWIEPRTHE
jgi:hypothetical protein